MPEQASITIATLLKYVWLPIVGAIGYLWKSVTKQVEENRKELADHKLEDVKAHEDFVSHDYMKSEIKPWLNRIDKKMDQLVTQTADVIKRDEYKRDIGALHDKIDKVKDMVR